MPSPELEQLLERIQSVGRRPEISLEDARAQSAAAFDAAPPPGVHVEAVQAGGVPAEWVQAPGVLGGPDGHVTLYLRGGGFCIGGVEGRRLVAAGISARANTRVLVVNYRLAPEHPFPAALEDVMHAYRWLVVERHAHPDRLAVVSDSAGGSLMFSTLAAAREQGLALPAAAVAISPWVDLDLAGRPPSRADNDPIVSVAQLERSAGLYLQGSDPRDPRASPIHADLTGLPPLLVQVGRDEVLLDDARRFADRASAAGVKVTLDVWDDVPHVWHLFSGLPEADQAIARVGDFLLSAGRVGVLEDRSSE